MSHDPIDAIPRIIGQLYELVHELEDLFPKRQFTPDGHLVGSIGEVLAAHAYGLELLEMTTPDHDAMTADGRLVQIKATQRRSVGLREEPEHLLVLALNKDGRTEEIFNGPGRLAWEASGTRQGNGQRSIGVARLKQLMKQVDSSQRLPRVRA